MCTLCCKTTVSKDQVAARVNGSVMKTLTGDAVQCLMLDWSIALFTSDVARLYDEASREAIAIVFIVFNMVNGVPSG